MTAHDVVACVRKICSIRQVGHAGTLDPMATGVLPVAVGKATRLLRFLGDDKTYLARVQFGFSTDTDDVEGSILRKSERIPSREEIDEALIKFTGEIEQSPPSYSAVHYGGERLYKLARRGEIPVDIPKRKVRVFSIASLGYRSGSGPLPGFPLHAGSASEKIESKWAELDLEIHCGSGTYIRSIARDLGEMLGSAACLSALQRRQAGPFSINRSVSLEGLREASLKGVLLDFLQPVESVLSLAKIAVSDDERKRLSWGQRVKIMPDRSSDFSADSSVHVLAVFEGKVLAVCSIVEEECPISEERDAGFFLKPEVVLVDGSSR